MKRHRRPAITHHLPTLQERLEMARWEIHIQRALEALVNGTCILTYERVINNQEAAHNNYQGKWALHYENNSIINNLNK